MFLLLNFDDYEFFNVFYGPKKNNMIMNGFFTKLIYSNQYITLYGLFFYLPLKTTTSFINHTSCLDISFLYKDTIQQLINIENHLLSTYAEHINKKNVVKNGVSCLQNQIQTGFLKYYKENGYNKKHLYIKISGIWETDKDFGITFKIIQY